MTRRVTLGQIASRLEERGLLEAHPAQDVELGGVADDSRAVRPGDAFCAWVGTAVDGHDFARAAVAAGASALIVERRLDEVAVPQAVVSDGRRAAAHAAALAFGDPAERMTLVGVTGTNGKTTTVSLLRHVLGADAASLGTLGVGREGGSSAAESALTTPGPVQLAATLARLADEGVRQLAMEVSSHALDQGRVDALRFDVAAFTNLSRDHLDYHGDEDAYRASKIGLLDLVAEHGIAVYNADEPAWDAVDAWPGRRLSFSQHADKASVCADGVVPHGAGVDFRILAPAGSADVGLPLVGGFNVENALAAATCALALGRDLGEVAERLSRAPQTPGRLERIAARPCPVLRDYAHTPAALGRALEALRPLTDGRLIVLFGAGGDRDRGKRPEMGRVAQQGADIAVVTSDNPRTEDPDAIIDDIAAGMRDGYLREVDRRAAIRLALETARPGDLILLAGKGHETYQVVGTEKSPFDEKEIVAALLGAERDEGKPIDRPLAANGADAAGGEW
ncbi:MAG: UDP-N-acetylmuramoyl-L-alanyl-D-glutamate--2,6-diaminopimelate ligase [Gemmatimonadota bacterium]